MIHTLILEEMSEFVEGVEVVMARCGNKKMYLKTKPQAWSHEHFICYVVVNGLVWEEFDSIEDAVEKYNSI